jgi:hypothetical protein
VPEPGSFEVYRTSGIMKLFFCSVGLKILNLIFAEIFYHMASPASKFLYWILFLASAALFIYAIAAHWEYLTLILPFVCTFFVKALDII